MTFINSIQTTYNCIVFIGEATQHHPVTIATLPHNRSFGTFKKEFQLSDACGFVTNGLQVGNSVHIMTVYKANARSREIYL